MLALSRRCDVVVEASVLFGDGCAGGEESFKCVSKVDPLFLLSHRGISAIQLRTKHIAGKFRV